MNSTNTSSGTIPPEAVKERESKQVIVIRRDLGMRRGKEIAQGGHASLAWLSERIRNGHNHADGGRFHGAHPGPFTEDWHVESLIDLTQAEWAWLEGLFTKVVCQVPDEDALNEVYLRALELKVTAHLIQDAGRTEFNGVPTFTACAIGPDWADIVDAVTGSLRLY